MNHGNDSRFLKVLFGSPEGLGSTGQFPEGKLNANDEGEIAIAIAADPETGRVIIDFGPEPVAWIGFSPEQAVDLAQTLLKKASDASVGKFLGKLIETKVERDATASP
jgi:hypothetical protein